MRCLTVDSTRTPTLAMPSAFSWPVLVHSALRAPAPVNLGFRRHQERPQMSTLMSLTPNLCTVGFLENAPYFRTSQETTMAEIRFLRPTRSVANQRAIYVPMHPAENGRTSYL